MTAQEIINQLNKHREEKDIAKKQLTTPSNTSKVKYVDRKDRINNMWFN